MNSIIQLLDLEDADVIISDIRIQGSQKILTLETAPTVHFCPACGFKMHQTHVPEHSSFLRCALKHSIFLLFQ